MQPGLPSTKPVFQRPIPIENPTGTRKPKCQYYASVLCCELEKIMRFMFSVNEFSNRSRPKDKVRRRPYNTDRVQSASN